MRNISLELVSVLERHAWPARSAAELARRAHIVGYDRRGTIFHAGEAADLIYVRLSGEVKLLLSGAADSFVLVRIARRGAARSWASSRPTRRRRRWSARSSSSRPRR